MKLNNLLSTRGALLLAIVGTAILIATDALLNQNGVFTRFIWGGLLNLTACLFFCAIITTLLSLFCAIACLDSLRKTNVDINEFYDANNNYVKHTGINTLFLMFVGALFGIMTACSGVTGLPFMRIICNFFAVLPFSYLMVVNVDNVALIAYRYIYLKLNNKDVQ